MSDWKPLLAYPFLYPEEIFSVAAVDDQDGEIAIFFCRQSNGEFYPDRYGPQDKRPGQTWMALDEEGWTAYAWTEDVPPFPVVISEDQKGD